MQRVNRNQRRLEMARNIGKHCRWRDETVAGTITGIATVGGGWPGYIIEWEPEAPDHWANIVSGTTSLIVEP